MRGKDGFQAFTYQGRRLVAKATYAGCLQRKTSGYLRYTKCDMKKYYMCEKGGVRTPATPLLDPPLNITCFI